MNSDKIEILLEGITKDLAELKEKKGGAKQSEPLLDNLEAMRAQLQSQLEKIQESHDRTERVITTFKQRATDGDYTQGIFSGEEHIIKSPGEMDVILIPSKSPGQHFKEILWPFPRLVWTLLISLLVAAALGGYAFLEYYQPTQDRLTGLVYKNEWLKRTIPTDYEELMTIYFENKEEIDQETDSLMLEDQKVRNELIDQKRKELQKLQRD